MPNFLLVPDRSASHRLFRDLDLADVGPAEEWRDILDGDVVDVSL